MKKLSFVLIITVCSITISTFLSCNLHSNVKDISRNQIVDSIRLLSKKSFYYLGNQPDTALRHAVKELELAEKIKWKEGKALAYNDIASSYLRLSRWSDAIDNYRKAQLINEEIGNKKQLAANLGNLGSLYNFIMEYDSALKYYQKALQEYLILKDTIKQASIHGNLGVIYINLKKYAYADNSLQKAIFINTKKDSATLLQNLANLGELKFTLSDFTDAFDNYYKSLRLLGKYGTRGDSAYIFIRVGYLFCNVPDSELIKFQINPSEKFKKALEFTNLGFSLAKNMNDISIQKDGYKTLSLIYERQKSFEKALGFFQQFSELQDSIFSKEVGDRMIYKEVEFQYELKNQIKVSAEEQAKKDKDTKKVLLYLLLLSIAITLFFSLVRLSKNKLPRRLVKVLGSLCLLGAVAGAELLSHEKILEITNDSPGAMFGLTLIVLIPLTIVHTFLDHYADKHLIDKKGLNK